MAAESLEMSHFRHGRGQKMCDLMLSWDGSELMRYPLSRGRLKDSCSFILRRKLRSGLEAIPSAKAGLGLGQGLASLSFLLLSASAQSSQGFLWLPRPLCAPQWWLVILGNLSLLPVPNSQTCLSFRDPWGRAPLSADSPVTLGPLTLWPTNLCPQFHGPGPPVFAMSLLGWEDPLLGPISSDF